MPIQKKATEHGQQPHGKSSHLHNPTGYTDEVAEEEHEFFDLVEKEAHLKDDDTPGTPSSGQRRKGGLESSGQRESSGQKQSSGQQQSSGQRESSGQQQKKKGGLESSGMGQTAQNIGKKTQDMGQKAGETMENVKNKAKGTMGMGGE